MRTVSYRIGDLNKATIHIGRVAENDYTRVQIDAGEIFAEYPHAAAALTVQPPAGEAYPAVVTREGDTVIWDVPDSALTEEGMGEIQLTFTDGETVVKSAIGRISVCRSIVGEGEAPDPLEDFLAEAGAALTAIPETIGAALEEAKESGEFDGSAGPAGADGADGFSPVVTVSEISGGHSVSVTDASGTETFNVMDGVDGQAGADGYSPSASVTKSGSTATIMITDKDGTTTAQISDGEGADVIDDTSTASDKAWSASKVSSELSSLNSALSTKAETKDSTATGIDLDVSDENGKVILRLQDGHIKTKYFDSGDVEEIQDTLDEISEKKTPVNLFDPSDYLDSEYIDSSYLLSNGSIGTKSQYSAWMVTPKIEVLASTQYTLTPKVWGSSTGNNAIRAYSSDDTPLETLTLTDNGDGTYTVTFPANTSYFRMSYYKNTTPYAKSIEEFKDGFMLVKGNSISGGYQPYFDPFVQLKGKLHPSDLLEKSYALPLWYGKKIVNFGDSIFGNIRPPKDMSTVIAKYTGADVYNCAFGGCRMGEHTGHWDAFSMYRLAYAIANNDFTVQDDAIQYDDRTSYAEVPLATLKSIDFEEVDMITIAYGTNDFGGGGNYIDNQNDPMDTSTLAGALRYSLDQIMTAFPKVRICILGIIYRDFSGTSSDTYVNAKGDTIADYNAKLKAVADEFHVRFIDNMDMGFNAYTHSTYYMDNTHPNNAGVDVYARHFANAIN